MVKWAKANKQLGWIDDFVDKHLQRKKFTFTDVQDFDSLNIRISSRQNKEWLLNFESCNLVWNHTRDFWFEVTIVISDQNCTTRSSVTTLLQPFWNRRIQSVPIFIWPYSRFVESGTRRLLHLFLYPKEKWCNIKAKMVRLKTKMTQFRTWTTRFRAKRWCDSWVNQSLKWVSKAPMLRASLIPRLWPSPPRTMGDRLHLPLSTAIIMIIILSRGLIQLAWVN